MSEGFDNFIFYKEWVHQLRVIATCGAPEDMAALCDGLEAFLDGEEAEISSPMAALVYNQMTSQILRDKEQYRKVSEQRSSAGKKGAEANASKRQQTPANDSKSQQTPANDSKDQQTPANDSLKDDDDVDDYVSPDGDISICAEPIIGLPLNDHTTHQVTQEDFTEYSRLYPAVDVMQELRKMRGWLMSNPTRRKTRRGIRAFITTWLAKCQDKAQRPPNTKYTVEDLLALPEVAL